MAWLVLTYFPSFFFVFSCFFLFIILLFFVLRVRRSLIDCSTLQKPRVKGGVSTPLISNFVLWSHTPRKAIEGATTQLISSHSEPGFRSKTGFAKPHAHSVATSPIIEVWFALFGTAYQEFGKTNADSVATSLIMGAELRCFCATAYQITENHRFASALVPHS